MVRHLPDALQDFTSDCTAISDHRSNAYTLLTDIHRPMYGFKTIKLGMLEVQLNLDLRYQMHLGFHGCEPSGHPMLTAGIHVSGERCHEDAYVSVPCKLLSEQLLGACQRTLEM